MIRLLKKILAAPFVILALIVFAIEDWLWDDLARLADAIGRLPIFRRIDAFIAWLPPYPSLLLFGTPSLLLIPVKFAALYFMSHGKPTIGFIIAVAAKFVGTALVAHIFKLTQPKLMQIGWFAWLYVRFTSFKKRIYEIVKSTAIYKTAHHHYTQLRECFKLWMGKRKGFWRRRWDATLRLLRKSKQSQE